MQLDALSGSSLQTPPPIVLVAEIRLPLTKEEGESVVIRQLSVAPGGEGVIEDISELNSLSVLDGRGCKSCLYTAASPPLEGEDPTVCFLSACEDNLILASPSSLQVLLPRVGPQQQEAPATLSEQEQQQQQQRGGRLSFRFRELGFQVPIVSVACGLNHFLVCLSSGEAMSFGANSQGQLGDGSFEDKTTFTRVLLDSAAFKAIGVYAGRDYSVAVCCSRASGVRTGGEEQERKRPRMQQHTEGGPIEKGGALFAWGSNAYGQLGQEAGSSLACSCVPLRVKSPLEKQEDFYLQVACGSGHVLALTDKGVAVSFGLNIHGQLGHGCLTLQGPPGALQLPCGLQSVACSDSRSLALARDGQVFAWGVEATYQPPPQLPLPSAWRSSRGGDCGGGSERKNQEEWQCEPPEAVDTPQSSDSECTSDAEADEEDKPEGAEVLADEPFSSSPGLNRVKGLPPGVSAVAAGIGFSCGVSTAGDVSTVFMWKSVAKSEAKVEEAVDLRVVARLPSYATPSREGIDKKNKRKLSWFCACSQRTILVWAREGESVSRVIAEQKTREPEAKEILFLNQVEGPPICTGLIVALRNRQERELECSNCALLLLSEECFDGENVGSSKQKMEGEV
ncbi:hypothetical protein Efla_007059 [Eimeria flavescens]